MVAISIYQRGDGLFIVQTLVPFGNDIVARLNAG